MEILLKVPPKSLLKFIRISKPWLLLISSRKLVKTHVKLTANDKGCSNHRFLFQDSTGNFKEQRIELFDIDSPMENPTVYTWIVGSVNGLICLYSKIEEPVLWSPTIRKCKKLPTFGANLRRVNIYSLKADSWRKIDKFQGNFLVNSPGKFVDGKLYWALSSDVDTFNMCNIISLDLTDETWKMLVLPISYGEGSYPLAVGVVANDLSVLCLNCHEGTNSEIFTMDHPKDLGEFIFFSSIFSIPSCQSNKGENLLLLPPVIMIYDGSTRPLEVVDQFEECFASEIYEESLVDPLLIAHNHLAHNS
ncbi:unnamed protein product [Withania somnifera]